MVTATRDETVEPWMERLFLPAYRVSEAARYVGVHPNTISAWHYRGDPILPGRTRRRPLSYLELIEVAFVALFRRLKIDVAHIREVRNYFNWSKSDCQYDSVPYSEIRDCPRGFDLVQPPAMSVENQEVKGVREYSVRNVEIKYPFASLRFKTERLHILMEYRKFDSSAEKWAYFTGRDTLRYSSWVDGRNQFADFDYDHEIVVRWYPAGRDSQVMIDPRIAFGDPMVSGLPTWVIRGRYIAGETVHEIVEDFEISESAILDALRFEGIQVS